MRIESGGAFRTWALLQKPTRTIVVDDSRTALKAICAVVERQGLRVVGTATNGRAALALAHSLQPDLVLMDVEMPTMDGIEATSHLQQECPATRVMIVTVHDSPELHRACCRRGACVLLSRAPSMTSSPLLSGDFVEMESTSNFEVLHGTAYPTRR